jgi:molybdopterin synthase catalytic subunit
MCLSVMAALAAEARGRWPLGAVVIAHRVGVVRPAEVSIFIGVAGSHRRAPLEALPWLLDEAKARLPVWKLEVGEDGERWVEGSAGAAPVL